MFGTTLAVSGLCAFMFLRVMKGIGLLMGFILNL